MINFKIFRFLFFSLIFLLFCISKTIAQENKKNDYVKYDKNYVFNDGIYLSFEEFKQNKPSIKEFSVIKPRQFSDRVNLEYPCFDTTSQTTKTCEINYCWGYIQNNNIYINKGVQTYFFKLHIIGALIHYIGYEVKRFSPPPSYDYPGFTSYIDYNNIDNVEYLIIFKTGERISFNYRNFKNFLKENDKELYEELRNTKRKRKMIYSFMIRYNEKNPIYFPLN